MKGFLAVVFMLAFGAEVANAGDGSLTWRSFDEGIAEAKKVNKKILIDIYTDWCSWCKVMDAKTYSDKNVIEYLSKKYVLIKLNAESAKKLTYKKQQLTERELAAGFGITGYPSTLFLNADGEPITVYPGFADASKFKMVTSFIAEDHYLNTKFEDYASRYKD
ncbi:MAG: DUF255 domain-containing protein [Ignavibacteriae bacterium]|nr:DUF255 domain-containing protein [Ignavibacteriota bacterium]